jgi:4-amino-4-deoxy-L-arabinose transferase-like glycosyltransferase
MTGVATAPRAASRGSDADAPESGRQRRLLLVILGVAFVVRLVWALYAARDPAGLNDPSSYLIMGHGIAAGDGYNFIVDGSPTAYFPVGYPAFVAAIVWIVEHTPLSDVPKTVAMLQVLIGTASVWLAWRIARRVWDVRTGLVAAALVAVFPGLVLYTAPLLSETLFVALELAAIAVVVDRPWDQDTPSRRRLVAFGALTAAAMYVRPQAALVIVAVAIGLAVARFGWRRALGAGAVALATAVLLIVPWTVRNAITMDAFVPISTNSGDDLCIGHNPGANGHFGFYPDCLDIKGLEGGEREIERDAKNLRVALDFMTSHPRREAWLLLQKVKYTYDGDYEGLDAVEGYGNAPFIPDRLRTVLQRLADGYFWVVLALALVAIPLLPSRRDGRGTMLLASMVGMALIPLAFFGDVRFHVPASPLFAIAAAVAIVRLPPLVRSRRARPT